MDRPDASHLVQQAVQAAGLPPGITLRPWHEDDFPAIQRLSLAEGWPTPSNRPADALRSWQAAWPALVALSGGSLIGFIRALSDRAVTTYIAEILVIPEWRGRGVGSALLAVAQHLCPGTRLDLLATAESSPFYQRAGFRQFPGYRRSWAEFAARPGIESQQPGA
jgi:GNAT superfamily N-acetyltransferase